MSKIVEWLRQRGVKDSFDHDVVEKLLQSLNNSFDSHVLTSKARPGYESPILLKS